MKPLERLRNVEADRRNTVVRTVAWSLGAAALVFGGFAVGHALGPIAMRPGEYAAGLLFSLVLGLGLGIPWGFRRRDHGATRLRVSEGERSRTIVMFHEYWVVDDEILLLDTIQKTNLEPGTLLLRYLDPVAEGPLLREFQGSSEALRSMAERLPQSDG